MFADIRRLASGSASSSRDLVVEASNQVRGARSASGSSASSRRGPGSPVAGREASGHGPERILPLAQVTKAAPEWYRSRGRRCLSVGMRLGRGAKILYPEFLITQTILRI